MSYFFENKNRIKLPPEHDRRRKIMESEYPKIRQRYKDGEYIRAIAREYNVDKRTIQFILFPERRDRVALHAKNRNQSAVSYAKVRGEKWAETMRNHRRYKKKVLDKVGMR